jgi:hypothetical protein
MAIRVITNPSKAQISRNAKESAVLVLGEDNEVNDSATKSGSSWYLSGTTMQSTLGDLVQDYTILALFYNDGK